MSELLQQTSTVLLSSAPPSRCLQPRLTIYVCQQQARHQPQLKPGGGDSEFPSGILKGVERQNLGGQEHLVFGKSM